MTVTRQQLKVWVAKAWERVSDLTVLRRLARMVNEVKTAPSSTLAVRLYDEALALVETLLGTEFEVIIPVINIQDNRRIRVEVDLYDIFANLLTVARFSDSDQKLWTIAKQVKLQESLFPSKVDDPELGMEASNEVLRPSWLNW